MMMAMGESGNSRRRQLGFLVTLLATILLGASTPAIAHKEH
jgi:hypothetical protein